jgi:hypothetical protein
VIIKLELLGVMLPGMREDPAGSTGAENPFAAGKEMLVIMPVQLIMQILGASGIAAPSNADGAVGRNAPSTASTAACSTLHHRAFSELNGRKGRRA